jgi:hypothetical protein
MNATLAASGPGRAMPLFVLTVGLFAVLLGLAAGRAAAAY